MKQLKIGILGATGAVGQEMISLLQERQFPVETLRLFSSSRTAGETLWFQGEKIVLEEGTDSSFEGLDIVLGAADNPVAERFAPAIVKSGALFIDNSSAFRMQENVPLVVPEINPQDAKKHHGIIASPNCCTTIALVAIWPLIQLSPITSMVVSTYQAVSGAGVQGIAELEEQTKALLNGDPITPKVFAQQIVQNVLPQIGDVVEDGYTSEEMKLQYEGRKILHAPSLPVSCTCVRVPVQRSHSISILLQTEQPISVEEAQEAIGKGKGVVLVDHPEQHQYPTPLQSKGKDQIYVGRIRKDLTSPNGLALWCTGDQIRKGAATNAIQIAELFLS